MITLETIRTDMEQLLAQEKNLHYVDVRADTLDEALADAASQLETRPMFLEYEVLEQGFKGVAGLMKKPWFIRAYENASLTHKNAKKKKAKTFLPAHSRIRASRKMRTEFSTCIISVRKLA